MKSAPPSVPTSLPSSKLSSELAAETLRNMRWRNLGPRGRMVAVLRLSVLTALVILISGLLWMEPSAWRIGTFVTTVAVVAAMIASQLAWLRRNKFTVRHIPYMMVPALVLHAAVVAITGGAESPFLVMLAIVGIFPAMISSRVKPFLIVASLPLALLWLFTLGATTHWLPDLTPGFLSGGHAYSNPGFAYTQAAAITIATLLGGAGIMGIRVLVERTAQTATAIRQELFDMMRERNRELLSLSGELAHELKNPLASIQGLSVLVERQLSAGSKEKEQMGVLLGEVKRMGKTLDEFLNFSRPVVGLSTRSVQPAELMAEVAQLHEGMALQRDITLTLVDSQAEPIICDARKIKQVLINLMLNALEATPQGGTVTTRVEPGPAGCARFVVVDSGPGIAAHVKDAVFEAGVTTKDDGSGLGLTIAQAIATQHGGSLELDDRPDGGCRAVLHVPPEPTAAPQSVRSDRMTRKETDHRPSEDRQETP